MASSDDSPDPYQSSTTSEESPSPNPATDEWDITDPRRVKKPVEELIHKNLVNAWKVHKYNQMYCIFDYVSPVRQWKRGTKYTDRDPCAEYGPGPPWPDLTETDEKKHPQKPYFPTLHVYVDLMSLPSRLSLIYRRREYYFKFPEPITLGDFLNKDKIEKTPKRAIDVGLKMKIKKQSKKKLVWRRLTIPYLYVQLISQLIAEDDHGAEDDGHESLRRRSYAQQVLDFVGKELRSAKGNGEDFRSKVLTPILQRYLQGVPNSYAPNIRSAISDDEEPTIAQVTQFYLHRDPLDIVYIPHYRRNLLYIVEARWYLGTLLGTVTVDSIEHFNITRDNHDAVMKKLGMESAEELEEEVAPEEEEPTPLTEMEIHIILDEGLEEFMKDELAQVVCSLCPYYLPFPTL